MIVYRLTGEALDLTYREWKKLGGNSPAEADEFHVRIMLRHEGRSMEDATLGEIQQISVVAGRGFARYALTWLGKTEWAEVEYDGERSPRKRWEVIR